MTDNHNYHTPEKGTANWNVPLNENFERIDTHMEIRDLESELSNYTPKEGAKFLATDSETEFIGDGTTWQRLASSGLTPSFEAIEVDQRVGWTDKIVTYPVKAGQKSIYDPASFQTAVNELDAAGGGLFLWPAGDVTLDSPLDLTGISYITFMGRGLGGRVGFNSSGTTLRTPVSVGQNIIISNATKSPDMWNTFHNLRFLHDQWSNGKEYSVDLTDCEHHKFFNCRFDGYTSSGGGGLRIRKAQSGTGWLNLVSDCDFDKSRLHIDTTDNRVSGGTFYSQGSSFGLKLSAGGQRVDGIQFMPSIASDEFAAGDGLVLEGPISNICVTNCYFDGRDDGKAGRGVFLDGANGHVGNVTITNCMFWDHDGVPVDIAHGHDVTVSGCSFFDNNDWDDGTPDIHVRLNSKNTMFVGNVHRIEADRSNPGAVVTQGGAQTFAGVVGCSVKGNYSNPAFDFIENWGSTARDVITDLNGAATDAYVDTTRSGDGQRRTFTIPFDVDLYRPPTTISITPKTAAAAGDYYVSSKSRSALEITYTSPPASGSNNLKWDVFAATHATTSNV